MAVLAASIAGVIAVKAWLRRLPARGFGDRRALLVEIGVVLAMAGLAAFVALLVEFAD